VGWGLKGHAGQLYNEHKVVANASQTFNNYDKIGVLLDMNTCTLVYFINGKKVLTYVNAGWKVRIFFIFF
jgi:hypothetical protein